MRIRDPIHGTIAVSDEEKAVIDSQQYQRLRHVRQLGFGDLAFPGATHTRHAHSLGAMHVGSRLFGAVAARSGLPEDVKSSWVACSPSATASSQEGSRSSARRGAIFSEAWERGMWPMS